MKHVTKTALAALAVGLALAAPARAADLGGHGGGMKDDSSPVEGYRSNGWSGFVITGMVGYADRDIKGNRSINGEGGFWCMEEVKGGPDGIEGNADDHDKVRVEHPLIMSEFAGRDGDFSSTGIQGGVELGYRRQMAGWVGELSVGLDLDGNSKVSKEFETSHDLWANGLPIDEILTGVGTMSIEKQGDIYAVLRLGRLIGEQQRLLVGVGGGLAVGRFNIKGGHAFDDDTGGLLSTSFDSTETAVGYVLEAYARYKLTQNLDAGLLGQYKDFGTIEASGHADPSIGDTGGLYAHVKDKASFDASEWVIKGTLTYTLD